MAVTVTRRTTTETTTMVFNTMQLLHTTVTHPPPPPTHATSDLRWGPDEPLLHDLQVTLFGYREGLKRTEACRRAMGPEEPAGVFVRECPLKRGGGLVEPSLLQLKFT